MSRVNRNVTQSEQLEETSENMQDFSVGAKDSQAGSTHARRIVVTCNASAEDLMNGKSVSIKNASDVFKPSYNLEDLDEEQQASFRKLDLSKGIVTGIKLKSVYSNCPENVTMSLNLYDNSPQITNNEGSLYTPQHTDMGLSHVAESDGFINLVNVLPYERARPDQPCYTPSNVLNNRFISEYGAYTLEKLWDGIVPFKGEDYFYVESDHVILRIISRNWEMLGINTEQERKRENKYVKVSKDVVNNVIKQLYEQVICQIPYTSFDSLQAKFNANEVPEGNYKVSAELLVEYKYPTMGAEN
tara:strand:- start:847 stop:1749 length:903 start_codon:yes stop_codon:yes gene_type:complete